MHIINIFKDDKKRSKKSKILKILKTFVLKKSLIYTVT